MSGPSVHQHAFPKKRFQAAVVAAIDQHAAAIGQVAERVEAQGGVLADLAVARDAAQQELSAIQTTAKQDYQHFEAVCAPLCNSTLWTRLRWVFAGK